MDKITAFRDGKERTFTRRQWDVMGIGHCGWKEVPQMPKEVISSVTKKDVSPKENQTISVERGIGSTMIVAVTEHTQATQTSKRRKK